MTSDMSGIHRSQGVTLEKAVVEIAPFAEFSSLVKTLSGVGFELTYFCRTFEEIFKEKRNDE